MILQRQLVYDPCPPFVFQPEYVVGFSIKFHMVPNIVQDIDQFNILKQSIFLVSVTYLALLRAGSV